MSFRTRFFYGWVIVAVVLAMMAVGYTLRNTFSVFYPTLVQEFGWDRGSTALMFSISILVYGAVAPLAGVLADRIDPRIVFSTGICLMGTAIALCSLATQQWQFYVLFGVLVATGLSMAGFSPAGTILARWFVRKRGLAFGIVNMGFGLGLLASPIIQSLISSMGYEQAYRIMGLFAIAVAVPLIIVFVRSNPKDKGTTPDGIPSLPVSPSHATQTRAETPWMSTAWTLKRAMRTRQFWLVFVCALCLMGLAQQFLIAHSVYLFRDVGFSPEAAARLFSWFGVGITIGYPLANLSDRYGRERVLVPGSLLSATAAGLLFCVSEPSHGWIVIICMFTSGLGIGVSIATFFATVADLFQGPHYGTIQGCVFIGYAIGGAFNTWFAGFLHDKTGSYEPSMIIVIGALTMVAILTLVIAPGKLRPLFVRNSG